MSAPRGPRGAIRSRGRGTARRGPSSRNSSDDESKKNNARRTRFGTDTASPFSSAGKQLKPPPMRNGFHTPRSAKNPTTSGNTSQQRSSPIIGRSASPASFDKSWRDPTMEGNASYPKRMSELYQTLKRNREKERKDAIRNGFLADPDKPTSLANAITPVGTCQDMCPEFERVERIVQLMVDGCEKTLGHLSEAKVPCEEYMVKRFRRSAAGYDEQLPSDIRPPLVLQKTLDYLLEQIIGGSQPLANVHKFVWDRTRGIRNDFSIQQVTKTEDLRIAIDCFERIARFHILSLHQLSRQGEGSGEFDHHQEREQLNNTLLSLMYYYDDSRHILISPNEAEFRAYCIIFEIQDQRPDLEDRAQNWPRPLLKDPRIQTALKLYAAAWNTADDQGPLRPRTVFCIAQSDYGRFFSIVTSNAVSYLMACVAEIYFNLVRYIALDAIWKAYKRGASTRTEDWILSDLATALGFDNEEQVQGFCEDHGFSIRNRGDGKAYLDLTSVVGRFITDSNSRRKQIFSKRLVEHKRLGRTLPAVINGVGALQARSDGMIEDLSSAKNSPPTKTKDESLFINGDSDEEPAVTNGKPGNSEDTRKSDALPKINFFPQTTILPTSFNPFDIKRTVNNSASPVNNSPFSIPSTSAISKPSIVLQSTPSFDFTSSNTPTPWSAFGTPIATNPDPFKPAYAPKFNFLTSSSTMLAKPTGNDTLPPSTTSQPSHLFTFTASPTTSTTSSIAETPNSNTPSVDFPRQTITIKPPVQESKPSIAPIQSSQSSKQPVIQPPFSFKPPESHITSSSGRAPSVFPPTNNVTPSLSNAPNSISAFFPSKQQQPNTTSIASEGVPKTELPSFNFSSVSPRSSSPPNILTPNAPLQSTSLSPQIGQTLPDTQKPTQNADSAHISASRLSGSSYTDRPASMIQKSKSAPSRKDPRPQALDALSKAVLLGDGGLLQQFIEHTVGPIISDAFRQRKDERSWERAHAVRWILLGRKYGRRWKEFAWKLSLLRKGRERRRNFAQSMQGLARSSHQRRGSNTDLGKILTSKTRKEDGIVQQPQITDMPPPPTPIKGQRGRKSLPADARPQHSPTPGEWSNKNSQRRGPLMRTDPGSSRITKIPQGYHKRSSTVGHAGPLHRTSKTMSSSSFSLPVASKSILSESTMAKARHLLAGIPTDTTRTDYFRLKAMGIDPDTPSVPATGSKRTRNESEVEAKKELKLTPADSLKSSSSVKFDSSQMPRQISSPHPAARQAADDSDEELLAQMRRVREAMSESISWFQEETAKSEFSRSSSESRPETAKEKRLREWMPTPSRTEQRLAMTGGHGLIPKDFRVSKSSRQPTEEMADNGLAFSQPQGFAAMNMGSNSIASTGFYGSRESSQDFVAKGSSVEDAIEL